MRIEEQEPKGYTGGLFEADIFPPVKHEAICKKYVPHSKAIKDWELVRKNQPWNPEDPGHGFAGDLHTEVADALGLNNYSDLRLFSAGKSSLDWHGTDGWFEFDGIKVTLDVSKNPAKEEGYRADFIIPPAVVNDPALRRELAETIALELKRKRQEAEACQQPPRPHYKPLIPRLTQFVIARLSQQPKQSQFPSIQIASSAC